jgi:hypothetical protein
MHAPQRPSHSLEPANMSRAMARDRGLRGLTARLIFQALLDENPMRLGPRHAGFTSYGWSADAVTSHQR